MQLWQAASERLIRHGPVARKPPSGCGGGGGGAGHVICQHGWTSIFTGWHGVCFRVARPRGGSATMTTNGTALIMRGL